ncbi:Basic phospholipase [Dirofilaria immitis]
MNQIYYFFLLLIFHITSISTSPLITNEIAKIFKLIDIRESNLAITTMANMYETTPAVKEINITESSEFTAPTSEFTVPTSEFTAPTTDFIAPTIFNSDGDLDSSQYSNRNTKSLEILGIKNASKSLNVEKFNVATVLESIYPSMSVSEAPENSISLTSTVKTSVFKDNRNTLEADAKEFNTSAVHENIHPSISISEAFENFVPLISALEARILNDSDKIKEFTAALFEENKLEQLESTLPSTLQQSESTSSSTLAELTSSSTLQQSESTSSSTLAELTSSSTLQQSESTSSSTLAELTSSSTLQQSESTSSSTLAELTSSSTLQQSESTSSSTLAELTSSSTLQQSESTSSSTNSMLSDGIRGEAKSGAIYEKTDGVPRKCQLHADCYDLREPEAWCDLKPDEYWIDGGCFCDEKIKHCIIELRKNNQLYYTDCRSQYPYHCGI